MKKQFLNLGKALNKAEQKSIIGGTIAIVNCNNGYAFAINPEGAFNPKTVCLSHGGYSHMTYD
ncbi:MAG: hypothetical protein IBX66_07205 [Lutibacter sp.]|nr:hypothetical protein [Lutibacter sp.]